MNSPSADGRTAVPSPLKKRPVTRRHFLLGSIGLASLAGAGTGGYSYWEAKNPLLVTPYSIVSPRWTPGQSLNITVIADLHAGGPNMGVERIHRISIRPMNCSRTS